MITSTVAVFAGCLAALIFDRTLGAAVQLWGLRRASQNLMRSADRHIERMRSFDKRVN
jgi:hypothetical protein